MGTVYKGISEAVLKNIAIITMTIDHVTAFLLKDYLNGIGIYYYSNGWYIFGRIIGRIAFVLFAYMLAEGADRTRSRAKYAMRLFLLAIISIVPHSYANSGKWLNTKDMNIFFLLFLGLMTIWVYDLLRQKVEQQALSVCLRVVVVAASCVIALLCNFEYGMMGILLIMAFYIFKHDFPQLAFWGVVIMSLGYMANVIIKSGGISWISSHSNDLLTAILNTDKIQIFGLLAFPLIYLYNGKKGRQLPKAFYYLFYPVHLAVIALILYVF